MNKLYIHWYAEEIQNGLISFEILLITRKYFIKTLHCIYILRYKSKLGL